MKGCGIMAKQVNIYYSVLQYVPSPIRGESLNVGIAFHVPAVKESRFISVKNKSRVSSFDDEWDSDFFDITMQALHEDIDWPTTGELKKQSLNLNYYENNLLDKDSIEYLYSKTSYLVNEFKFGNVITLVTNEEDIESDIKSLEKTYLYYDHPKSQRITTPEARKLLKKSFKGKKDAVYTPKIQGDFDNKSIIDYKVNDYYIKVTSFDYANNATRAKELKSSLYDIETVINYHGIKKLKIVVAGENDVDQKKESKNVYSDFKTRINDLNKNFKSDIRVEDLRTMLERS